MASSGFGIWEYELATGKMTWDRQMCEIYGVDPETFRPSRESWREFVHPEDREIGSQRFDLAIRGLLGGLFESRIIRQNGSIIHIEGTGRMHYDENGQPQSLFGLNRDITERKNAELHKALTARAMTLLAEHKPLHEVLCSIVDHFEATHSSVFCSILLLDSTGRRYVFGAGPRLEPFFDRYIKNFEIKREGEPDPAWIRSRIIADDVVTPPEWEPFQEFAKEAAFQAYWAEPIMSGSRVLGTFAIYHPRSVRPSKNDIQIMEACAQLAAVAITHSQTEEALERERAKLASSIKMAALGEMASGIAHEINNPLTVIVGKAWQLMKMAEDVVEDAKDKGGIDRRFFADELAKIVDVSNRIAKVIKGLQSFSRNAENDPLEGTPIHQIIEDALALSKERFRNNGVDLRLLARAPGVFVAARPAQLSQVLVNLLNNAFDAVAGQSQPWVEISVTAAEDAVVIAVVDSGAGLDPAIADKIMQPFFTTKDVGKGTGLGLSISKGIIEDHGGKFYYDPQSRHTRFVIELPRRILG